MRVDSHQHFWRYKAEEHVWMNARMQAIRRDFLPADLASEIKNTGVDGVVTVQARQTVEETRWLLELADRYSFVKGVVGWAPLASHELEQVLHEFTEKKNLKGMRHVVHDEADDRFILRSDFNRGVSSLKRFDLVYDILIFERHLPQTIEFVDRHPQQIFVLDHVGKPRIKGQILDPWRENIRRLAERENVFCKLSGMVTEADWQNWSKEDLQPYFDVVLEAFGAERLMFGSDWPVCLLASAYARWHQTVLELSKELSAEEQKRLLGKTAIEVYQLSTPD